MSDLFIQTRGRGDIHMVLIHGWAMHGDVFEPLFDALGERCTMHAVDLPGHGRSRDSAWRWMHPPAPAPSPRTRRRRSGWAGRWADWWR